MAGQSIWPICRTTRCLSYTLSCHANLVDSLLSRVGVEGQQLPIGGWREHSPCTALCIDQFLVQHSYIIPQFPLYPPCVPLIWEPRLWGLGGFHGIISNIYMGCRERGIQWYPIILTGQARVFCIFTKISVSHNHTVQGKLCLQWTEWL